MIPDDQRESRAESRDETFTKKERLIKTKDFRKVYQEGRSFKAGFTPLDVPSNAVKAKCLTGFIILKISANTALTNRVGFSISAKSIKRANKRNRIKRLFREAYRKNKKILKKGFDIVFVVRRDTKCGFSYKDAEEILLSLSKQAGILL